MKTPGLAHQLISIQCTVNTDHEQKLKVTPKITLKCIGITLYYIKINQTFFNTIIEAAKGTWSVQC